MQFVHAQRSHRDRGDRLDLGRGSRTRRAQGIFPTSKSTVFATHRIQTVQQFVLRSHGKGRYQLADMACEPLSARTFAELPSQAFPDHVPGCGDVQDRPLLHRRPQRAVGNLRHLDITLPVDGEVDAGAGSYLSRPALRSSEPADDVGVPGGHRPAPVADSPFTIANTGPPVRSQRGPGAGRRREPAAYQSPFDEDDDEPLDLRTR
ncbi:hypothetical protein Scani_75330 [Streptomyces caniferus]|uniref:Uncharacterized protein n=1 Tax=Streptomyces caniferus TaxID=285557 RepID=A0A640SP68_9ACTN|nr:hypothetical protein Scani_75330 [Streptomyces caniferus]